MTGAPESISDLAEQLGRNYADVQVLADHYIVYFDTDGWAKHPVIPYDRIVLDVEVAPNSRTEPAHA